MINGQMADSEGRIKLIDKDDIEYIYIRAIWFRDIDNNYIIDHKTGNPICLVSGKFKPQWLRLSNTFISINEDLEFLLRF